MDENIVRAIPTPSHLEWADMEIGVIIHYLIDAYKPEFTEFKTKAVRTELPPSVFAPEGWDTDQWCRSASELGAKYAVLVANHGTGFSLWQTKVNDYSVASCSYKDGKGDIVRDFIESCKKYNLKPGLYYSLGCNGYYGISDESIRDYKSEEYQTYIKNVEKQVTELWSEYGELFEIWFDGGVVPKEQGGPDLIPILKKYQPNAMCFQGPVGHTHNLRWVGNENGLAPADCFSATDRGECQIEVPGCGSPFGKYWEPAETDMPNRDKAAFGGGWNWKAGEENYVYTPEHLLDCYIRSVGRNSNLLLGMAIATNGRFEDEQQFIDFGRLIDKTFGDGACIAKQQGSTDKVQKILLPEKRQINYVVLKEDITRGHGILSFSVEADGVRLAEGKCVGHKRIIPVDICAKEICVTLEECYPDAELTEISLY